jgi:hypothetical protein
MNNAVGHHDIKTISIIGKRFGINMIEHNSFYKTIHFQLVAGQVEHVDRQIDSHHLATFLPLAQGDGNLCGAGSQVQDLPSQEKRAKAKMQSKS